MTTTTTTTTDEIVAVRGVRLARRAQIGPRGGNRYIYQSEDADRDWAYWYGTAREAIERSNPSDRICVGI